MIIGQANLNYRQKTLIGLIRVYGGRLSKVDFQKYLFLFTQEFEQEPSFEFVPYRFGCFSFQSGADKRRLVEVGALHASEDWHLRDNFIWRDTPDAENTYRRFHERYASLRGVELVRDIYRRYPYYAINSVIAHRLMDAKEKAVISERRPSMTDPCLFTIGYEGASFEGYLNRLISNNVKVLVDVRRNALSRKYGFSKKTLSETVQKLGIEYVHIPELGIASDKRRELKTQSDYDRLLDTYENVELSQNQAALDQLFGLFVERKRIAITCFEAQSCMCHRGRVAKALSALPTWSYPIKHV